MAKVPTLGPRVAALPPARQRYERQEHRALRTSSTRWRAIRGQVLADDPYCVDCRKAGRVRLAVDVDHVDNNPRNNERSNLQGLCRRCHSAKTAREAAALVAAVPRA